MTPDCVKRIEDRLRGRARVLLEEVEAHRARPFDNARRDSEPSDRDDANEYPEIALVDLRILEAGRNLVELRAIDTALERLAAGKYGVCEDCGDEIERDRIEAHPTTTWCLICQLHYERTYAQTRNAWR